MSRYGAGLATNVVFFISNSMGYMQST